MQSTRLRDAVQSFVRAIGVLGTDRTPCGQAMPVSEAHALMALLANEGDDVCLTATDLADHLNIDKSNVSRMCKRMEKAGAIQAVVCEQDRRVKRLQLTKKGARLAAQVEAASNKRFAAVARSLPRASSRAVLEAVELLTAAIRQSERSGTDTSES